MPDLNGASLAPNGAAGGVNGTRRPSMSSHLRAMALTEYSANPSPPSGREEDGSSYVPEEYRLPDGYPDVSSFSSSFFICFRRDQECKSADRRNFAQVVSAHDCQRNLTGL